MRKRKILAATMLLLTLAGLAFAQRRGPRFFPFRDDEDAPMPADAGEKTEFAFARLQYPNWRSNDRMWSMRGAWSIDYPKADRQFVQGVRRLTRLHVRSVEQVVNLHPGVTECCAIGVPDERWGETGRAFIVLKPGATLSAEAILAHCLSRLAKFKVPARVVVTTTIPRTASGKVVRSRLEMEAPSKPSLRADRLTRLV